MTLTRTHITRSFFTWLVLFAVSFSLKSMASPVGKDVGASPIINDAPAFGLTITITITHNFALADGIQQNSVLINITNAGVPVAGQAVTFIINGGASGINPVITTDANGDATLSLSSTVAGPATVQALVNALPVGPVTVTFVLTSGPPDPTNPLTQLIVDVPSNTADGVSQDQVHAHVVDVNGNPVTGATVVFAVAGGTAGAPAVIVGTGITDASGNAILSITDTKSGTVLISAKVGGIQITNSPATVNFVAGAPDLSNPLSQLIIDVGTTTADGASVDKLHAHIVDAFGNPVAGVAVSFNGIAGTALATAVMTNSGVTDANGDEFYKCNNTTVGTVIVAATVGGVMINNSPATIFFVVGPPSVANPLTRLIVDIGSTTADGVSTDQVHAHVVDAKGNPVPNATVVFTVAGGTAGGSAVIVGTGITDASGNAILTISDPVAGNVLISATIGGVAINNSPATVLFVAGAPSPSNPATQLIVDIGSTAADGVSTDQVHAHVVDANGNPVAGATVVFTVSGGSSGGTAVITGTGITDASGNAVLTITNTIVGTVFIAAKIGGVAINSSPATVVFVAGAPSPSNPATQLIVDIGSTAADGVSTDKVHAHVVDANGNPVPGASVVFTIAGGTAGGTAVIAGSGITDASGNASLTISNTAAGTVFISATVGGVAINSSPATVVFVAGAPDLGKSIIVIDQNFSPTNNSTPDILHAHIVDANGNPVSGQAVTFTILSGTVSFPGPFTVITDVNGNGSISLVSTVAGNVSVGGQLGGVDISNSPVTIVFTNKPDVTNPQTALIVVVFEAFADGVSTTSVKAHIVDQGGNILPGQSVMFSIDSGNAQIVTVQPVITDANGDAFILITSKTVGDVLVTATVAGIPIVNGSPARVRFAGINIYVPRVFSPNGDGTNDILKPILVGITNFHYFSVYNRWGNLIFTTQDPNAGWDGRFKGVPQPVETYLWMAEGIDAKGNRVVQKGMVSLVR
jgi:gliding motility-associated-like protein